jgi:hypothetical protein
MAIALAIAVFWIRPALVGHAIGKSKNRSGGLWGFALGWIGVVIVAVLSPRPPMSLEELEKKRAVSSPEWYEKKRAELLATRTHRVCPHCKERMRRDASACPHCQRDSQAWTLHEGRWWTNVDGTWYWLDELPNSWQRSDRLLRSRFKDLRLPDPMLARSRPLPSGSGWCFELKWDGSNSAATTMVRARGACQPRLTTCLHSEYV